MSIRTLTGDCRDLLPTLPTGSVQTCVTSPPYYGLRDYGTAQWDGGDADCDHQAPNGQGSTGQRADRTFTANQPYRSACGKCGARRVDRQIGLEQSPEDYLATMVAVFRELRRVLRDDGTVFCNIGDGYSDKQLLMMPARLALALQADGWWLRSAIVWSKPNPMPESVTDRPTSSYEMVYLLAKNARYYWDAEAIAEPTNCPEGSWGRSKCYDGDDTGKLRSFYGDGRKWEGAATRNARNVWTIATAPFSEAHFATFPPELAERCIRAGSRPGDTVLDPFSGAGTTLLVADRLQRHAVGIELNPEYAAMGTDRVRRDAPLLADIA